MTNNEQTLRDAAQSLVDAHPIRGHHVHDLRAALAATEAQESAPQKSLRDIVFDGPDDPHAPVQAEALGASLPFAILDDEIAALERFHECVADGEGYDVAKPMMQRLACIGLVRRVTANFYEHTNFGLSVLNGDFAHPAPSQSADQVRDAARYRWLRSIGGITWSYPGTTDRVIDDSFDASVDAAIASSGAAPSR